MCKDKNMDTPEGRDTTATALCLVLSLSTFKNDRNSLGAEQVQCIHSILADTLRQPRINTLHAVQQRHNPASHRTAPHLSPLRLAELEGRDERHPFPELHQVAQDKRARSARTSLAVHQACLPLSPSRVDVSESRLQYRRIHILDVMIGRGGSGGGGQQLWMAHNTYSPLRTARSENVTAKFEYRNKMGSHNSVFTQQLQPRR